MAFNNLCKFFDDGMVRGECGGWEPSDPPMCYRPDSPLTVNPECEGCSHCKEEDLPSSELDYTHQSAYHMAADDDIPF